MRFRKSDTLKGFAFMALLMMSACATEIGSKSYSDASVGEVAETQPAIVLKIRAVRVGPDSADKSKAGMIAGGIGGGLIGSELSSGLGGSLATLGLAGAGALGGAVAEKSLKTQNGIEITVRLANGGLRTLVQGNDVSFKRGEHVLLVVYLHGRSKIVKAEDETADSFENSKS